MPVTRVKLSSPDDLHSQDGLVSMLNSLDDEHVETFVGNLSDVYVARHSTSRPGYPSSISTSDVRHAVLSHLIADALTHANLPWEWTSRAHQLFRDPAEHAALDFLLGRASAHRECRVIRLQELVRVAVPRFVPNITSLVSMRRNDEHFANFRNCLTSPLERTIQGGFESGIEAAAAELHRTRASSGQA